MDKSTNLLVLDMFIVAILNKMGATKPSPKFLVLHFECSVTPSLGNHGLVWQNILEPLTLGAYLLRVLGAPEKDGLV